MPELPEWVRDWQRARWPAGEAETADPETGADLGRSCAPKLPTISAADDEFVEFVTAPARHSDHEEGSSPVIDGVSCFTAVSETMDAA